MAREKLGKFSKKNNFYKKKQIFVIYNVKTILSIH